MGTVNESGSVAVQLETMKSVKASSLGRSKSLFGEAVTHQFGSLVDRYIRDLSRLSRASAIGDQHKAARIVKRIICSFPAKLVSVVRSHKECSDGAPFSFDIACQIADALNLHHPIEEPVRVILQPKLSGGWRPVCSFGPKRRAAQSLCLDLLRVQGTASSFDFLYKGRGPELACDRICELAELEGCTHFVLADISNFFGSLEQEYVRKALPLPASVVSNALLINQDVEIVVSPYDSHITTPSFEDVSKAVRRGIPQGSRASSFVASTLLGPALKTLPCGERVVFYGDDIAAGACNKAEASVIKEALQSAMKSHPAGPLSLKRCDIKTLDGGFDFVKYRFRSRLYIFGGGVRITPARSSYRRYAQKVRMIAALTEPKQLKTKVAQYMRHWVRSFRRWKKYPLSWILLQLTTRDALATGLLYAQKKTLGKSEKNET